MSASLESLMSGAVSRGSDSSPMRELLGFLAVGAGGALVFVALSSVIIGLPTGWPAWVVSTLCYAALIGPVYLLHRQFSFRSDMKHRVAFFRYVTVQASALCLAAAFSWLFYAVFHLESWLAAPMVTVVTAGVNFVVLKFWAFAVPRAAA